MPYIKIVGLILISSTIAGCKVEITPSSKGTVKSNSGVYNCSAKTPCLIDVVDFFFDETFIPVAGPGYAFTGWQAGLCGNSLTNCRLNTKPLAGNDDFERIIASDDIFPLTPGFSPHDRNGYSGEWDGYVAKTNNTDYWTEDSVGVEISVSGSSIELIESRFFEEIDCEYTGSFHRKTISGRRAAEIISGTFQCNTTPFRRGTFTGTLQRATPYTLIADIKATDNDGLEYGTAYALTVNSSSTGNEPPLNGQAAIPSAKRFTAEHFGEYRGGMAISSDNCDGQQQATSTYPTTSDYSITRENDLIEITNDDFSKGRCVYSQAQKGKLSGSYQCTDFSEGNWTGKLQSHKTNTGRIFSMRLDTTTTGCQAKIEFIGIRGTRKSSQLEDDLRAPIPSITGE